MRKWKNDTPTLIKYQGLLILYWNDSCEGMIIEIGNN